MMNDGWQVPKDIQWVDSNRRKMDDYNISDNTSVPGNIQRSMANMTIDLSVEQRWSKISLVQCMLQ